MSADLIRSSPFFDEAWYLENNPDIGAAGVDPAQHYLDFGWIENREPGPEFSGRGYLRAHADVREAKLNPLLHYVLYGQHEGRLLSSQHEIWASKFDTLDELDRAAIQDHIGRFAHRPLISIVVPVYQTKLSDLREMLASVFNQAYPSWELCVADDHSADDDLSRILEEAAQDARVRLAVRSENGNICQATNTALENATGDWVCFLDHDDLLHENALYEIAVELNAHPDADIVYTDCDSIDDVGLRFNPFFKPDWNYDLMLGQNIVNHLAAYRRSIVEEVGRMRVGYEGSQDYDLALRAVDATCGKRIRHIPVILYHWRRSAAHASFSDADHKRCVDSARLAITDHLLRRGVQAQVEPNGMVPNFTRIVYRIPVPAPLVSVCVLESHGNTATLQSVFATLFHTAYESKEVLVATREASPSLEKLQEAGFIRMVPAFEDAVADRSRMVKEARGDVVVLLESDLQIDDPGWLTELVSHALREDVGAVGPLVIGADGKIQDAGIVIGAEHARYAEKTGNPGYFANLALTREVSALPSTCIAFRRSSYTAAGGLPLKATLRETEVEFCQSLRKIGLRNILVPSLRLRRSGQPDPETAHPQSQDEDPFYNPNLSVDEVYQRAVASRRPKPWQETRQRLAVRRGQTERSSKLLAEVPRSARLIEIGPSYSPIAPRSEGWDTTIIDHASREHLVKKYAGTPDLWVERIEEVDHIWRDGPIASSIPERLLGTFDFLIASHVIEHIPDFIGFLQSASQVLKDSGSIILAIPDKRFCFDYFRQITMTGDVLEAFTAKRTRHTRKIAFEHLFHTALNRREGAWGQAKVSEISLANSFDPCVGWLAAFDANSSGDYIDYHAWQFTPSSFELLLLELARLGHIDWSVERVSPATGCEFYAILRRGGKDEARAMPLASFDEQRLALLKKIVDELGVQAGFAAV